MEKKVQHAENLIHPDVIDNVHDITKLIVTGYLKKVQLSSDIDIIPRIVFTLCLLFYHNDNIFLQFGDAEIVKSILLSKPERLSKNPKIDYNKSCKYQYHNSQPPLSIVIIGTGKLIQIYKLNDNSSPTLLQSLVGHSSSVIAVKFNHNSTIILSQSIKELKIWQGNPHKVVWSEKAQTNCSFTKEIVSIQEQKKLNEIWTQRQNSFEDIIDMVSEDLTGSILVKTLTNKIIKVDGVSILNTINDLKNKIKDKEGIPCDTQRLIYAGWGLINNKLVGDYRMYPHLFSTSPVTVHLVLRLRRW